MPEPRPAPGAVGRPPDPPAYLPPTFAPRAPALPHRELSPPAPTPAGNPAPTPATRRPRRWPVVVLALAAILLSGTTVYLWRTSDAWQRRAADYEAVSIDLGGELGSTRLELETTTAELEAVTDQLTTAQARILELADEKAQIGDDREAQRLLVDYQERVSEAAGRVALALDQCVRGQNQLIGYLENAELYAPEDLAAFEADVADLCQAATDANTALQSELSR